LNYGINLISMSRGGGRQIALGYLNYLNKLHTKESFFISSPLTKEFQAYFNNTKKFIQINRKDNLNVISRTIFDNFFFKKQLNNNRINSLLSLGNLSCLNTSFKHIVLVHQAHLVYSEKEVFPLLTKQERIRKKLEILYFSKMIDSTDVIITQTELMKEKLINRYSKKLSNKLILVLPNSLFPLHNYQDLQKKNFFDHYYSVWLIPTQYYPHKNLELILKLAEVFKTKNINIKFLLTITQNDHQNSRHFLQKIKEKQLSNYFINKGFVNENEMPTLMNESTGVLFPSYLESQCFGMLEAMALRKPMICSDTEFNRSLCKNSAIYINVKKHNEWAEIIVDLSESEFERNKLSKYAGFRFEELNGKAKNTFKTYWEIQSQY